MQHAWQLAELQSLSAPSKRPGISPNVLWLEFWSFKIFLFSFFFTLVFSALPLLSLQFSLLQPLCVSHRIMSSSSSHSVPCSLLQPRASLIWILLKSAVPVIVGFPWKVTLSLKPITIGCFKITFALFEKAADRWFLPAEQIILFK